MAAEPASSPPPTDDEKLAENVVAVWSKAVDTQMHFNEMSVKSRQLGLTFVAAALGLAAFFFSHQTGEAKYSFEMRICGGKFQLQLAEFIVIAAAIAVYAVKILDLGVYHKMLRGAVAFGEDLEEFRLKKILGLSKGMTQAISHFSRHSDAMAKLEDGKMLYSGFNTKTAYDKISRFYHFIIAALLVCAICMFAIGNWAQ